MTQVIKPTTLYSFSIEVINDNIGKIKIDSFNFSPGKR